MTTNPLIRPIQTSEGTGPIAVGAATTEVLAGNGSRGETDITNTSDPSQPVYLERGADAVMGQGIALMARGSSYHIGVDNMWEGEIDAICADGEATLAIEEGTRP